MKNQVYSLCKRHIFKKSVCLILIFAVTLSNYTNIYPGSQVEAASQGLAQFEELKIDDNKSWFTSNAQEGGTLFRSIYLNNLNKKKWEIQTCAQLMLKI